MRPTDHLRALSGPDWQHATDHPFCRELAAGTLPLEKMRWYLVQDYKFIDAFTRLLATALAHAPTLADAVPAAQFLAVITGPENTYFLRAFEALEISEDARDTPAAAPTRAFQELMIAARHSGSYAEMLAVLTVAEWSYLTWGERHAPPAPDLPFWFAEWITLHSGEGFASVIAYLREQLDRAWEDLDESQRARVEQIFKQAVAIECAFFDAAYAA
ncbi:TenA family protein [Sulfitobacter aestuarii]|uniref:Aminopyrimidine aminohydrolase n=1 Tax=Sulfitobacter aestuarii TaxID=2161676 RepID=A0ABW5U1S5_9RHOB